MLKLPFEAQSLVLDKMNIPSELNNSSIKLLHLLAINNLNTPNL